MAKSSNISNVVFPMVRRVFASTIGSNLTSVKPMSTPKGFAIYAPPAHDLHEKQKKFLIWFVTKSGHYIADAFEISKIISSGL